MNSLWIYPFQNITFDVSVFTRLLNWKYEKEQINSLAGNRRHGHDKKYKPKTGQRILHLLLNGSVENNTIPIGKALL